MSLTEIEQFNVRRSHMWTKTEIIIVVGVRVK